MPWAGRWGTPVNRVAVTAVDDERAAVMKGRVDERAECSTMQVERVVNSVEWARESLKDETCQERADTKAFTGKGTRQELRQLIAEIDRLEQAMRELASVVRQVPGASIYLMLHHKRSNGYTFLRWRELGAGKRHLSWTDVQALLQSREASVRAWYGQASEQALSLNAQHLTARKRIRALRYILTRAQQPVYARRIPG